MCHLRRLVGAGLGILGLLVCLLSATVFAQRDGFLLFTDPSERFAVEFPKDWRWMMVAGSGEALVTFVQPRSEAAIVVERFRLKQVLADNEITDLFAQIEGEVLKENQPKVSDVVAKISTQGGRRVVLIDYRRPGQDVKANLTERVRQYSFPVGGNLYRITCMAISNQFNKYADTFDAVAGTLKSAGEVSKPAGR